jgi:Mu-like prophage I protein
MSEKQNILIQNREATTVADGWFQIEVSGEHLNGATKFVIDQAARAAMIENFKILKNGENFSGILIDADHLSHRQEHKTEAYGWLMNLEDRTGQLFGEIMWTSLGKQAVDGKVFKFFSTEYHLNKCKKLASGLLQPFELSGLALTNRPNNRGGKPISNRDDQSQDNNKINQINIKNMKQIAEKLGLPPEATEVEVLAALDTLIAENDTQKKTAQDEKAKTEAEAVMNRFSDRMPAYAKSAWMDQLLANREAAESLMEKSFPVKKEVARIHNRGGEVKSTLPEVDNEETRARKQEAATQLIRNRDKCNYLTASSQAALEHPELFN